VIDLNWHVYCRHDLVAPSTAVNECPTEPSDSALLLEGSWPADSSQPNRCSLDVVIDGRLAWIDRQAAALADAAATAGNSLHHGGTLDWAYLNALTLRYYFVKLIRPVAFFSDVRPLGSGDRLTVRAEVDRDDDYVDILRQVCRNAGAECRVLWVRGAGKEILHRFPPNGKLRRLAGWLAEHTNPKVRRGVGVRRIMLLGNPRLLDPLGRQLRRSGCQIWWLYDRFACRSWLAWRRSGVGQLTCNVDRGPRERLHVPLGEELSCRGIHLAPTVRRWLQGRVAGHGQRQTRMVDRIDAHLRPIQPHALVLDEDATPFARAAVAVARQQGIVSLVLQHGVPCCRFGFSPLAADHILAWGASSRDQLTRWGVPESKIHVTGSPAHDRLCERLNRPGRSQRTANDRPRILLLATVPPRDSRPDAVTLHLTSRSNARLLEAAFASVARISGAQLLVKLHPRTPHDAVVQRLCAAYPSLRGRVIRRGSLSRWLSAVDCVLSCGSSAGVEATLAGLPVIQLLSPGSREVLPHDRWGLVGTAGNETELDGLLAKVLDGPWQAPSRADGRVFGNHDTPAAVEAARVVLEHCSRPSSGVRQRPHFQTSNPKRQRGITHPPV